MDTENIIACSVFWFCFFPTEQPAFSKIVAFFKIICHSFVTFLQFSLWAFYSFTGLCPYVNLFLFILLEICWTSRICGWLSSVLQRSQPLPFQILPLPLSLFFYHTFLDTFSPVSLFLDFSWPLYNIFHFFSSQNYLLGNFLSISFTSLNLLLCLICY